MGKEWQLVGFDAFEEAYYDLPGNYIDEKEARNAGLLRFAELNQFQPIESSGGQGDWGIQDRIFIQRPDGSRYRFIPTAEELGQKPK